MQRGALALNTVGRIGVWIRGTKAWAAGAPSNHHLGPPLRPGETDTGKLILDSKI